jgi:hypothetical protein
MKRTIFTLIGLSVLMSFPFVSCEDKLLDDNKGSGENTGESPYRTLQDSTFRYLDGKLRYASYYFYDSIGNDVKSLFFEYDNEGNLIYNQKNTYFSDGNEKITYSYYNFYGQKDDLKCVVERSGSGVNYFQTQKCYALHEGNWILINETHNQRENNSQISNSVQYAMYNGEMIVVSRSKTSTTYNSVSGYRTSIERENYSRNCYYSDYCDYPISSNGFRVIFGIINYIQGESWQNSTQTYDEHGNEVEDISLTSNDSIVWNGNSTRYAYDSHGNQISRIAIEIRSNDSIIKSESSTRNTYDSHGNLIEKIEKENGFFSRKYSWKYNNQDKLLNYKSFVWSDSDIDFILEKNYEYTYSPAGVLVSVEMNSTSNDISFTQWPQKQESQNINIVMSATTRTDMGVGISGARCSIKCDSKGNPASEFLYKLNSDDLLELFARCALEYDSNGNCVKWVIEQFDEGAWRERASETYDSEGRILSNNNSRTVMSYYNGGGRSTTNTESCSKCEYDSNGNLLYSYSNSKSVIIYDYSENVSSIYCQNVTQESESRTECRYNEHGLPSYRIQSSTAHAHYVYSDGREVDNNSDSRQEAYYSTIKVK